MSRVDLGLAANDVLFPIVGFALLYALGLARLRPRDVQLVGLAYLAGWALVGSVLALALIVGIDPEVETVLVVSALLTAAGLLVGTRTAAVPCPTASRRRSLPALAACALGGAILAIAAAAALVVALKGLWNPDWDAVVFWLPKAETIYYLRHLDPTAWGAVSHPEYPPLVPAMNAATFHFVGGFHPSVLPFQQVLLGIAFLLAVLVLLDRFAPRWIAFPSLALLVTTPWFWWRLQSTLPDQTVAYLVATAALVCVIWLKELQPAWLGLALVLLVAATLGKLEGGFFATLLVAAVLAAGFVLHRRAALPALVLVLAPAAILPWHVWLAHHGLPPSATDYHATDLLDPGYLAHRTGRLTFALRAMVQTVWNQRQTAVIVILALAVLVGVARRIPVIAVAVAAWLALSFFGLASIYWIGKLEVHLYVSESASRVGATIVIAAATLTPLLLGLALQPPLRARERPSAGGDEMPDRAE